MRGNSGSGEGFMNLVIVWDRNGWVGVGWDRFGLVQLVMDKRSGWMRRQIKLKGMRCRY